MPDTDPKRQAVAAQLGAADETWERERGPPRLQMDMADIWRERSASRVISTIGPIEPAPDDAADGILPAPENAGSDGRRGPGRPPGSRARATEVWRRWMVGRWGSPLDALGRLYSADPVHLAAYLGCKPIEATAQIVSAARVALPYAHQALPADVRIEGKGAFAFAAFAGQAPAGGDAQSEAGDPSEALRKWYSEQSEENQRVIDGEIATRNDLASGDPDKT